MEDVESGVGGVVGGRGGVGGLTQDEIIWEGSRFVGSREKLPLKWIFGPTIGNMKLFDQNLILNRVAKAPIFQNINSVSMILIIMTRERCFELQRMDGGEGMLGVLPIKADGDGFCAGSQTPFVLLQSE